MFDGLTLNIRDYSEIERIRNNEILEPLFQMNKNHLLAKYKGLIIELHEGFCRIRGSLHMFKNDGDHNADDFTYSDLVNTLQVLEDELSINPQTAKITSLEIGVILKLDYDPSILVESIKGVKHARSSPIYKGLIKSCGSGQQCELKVYSKSRVNPRFINDNLFRYEVRVKSSYLKSQVLKLSKEERGDIYLSDLLSPSVWLQSGLYLRRFADRFNMMDIGDILEKKAPVEVCFEALAWEYRDRLAPNNMYRSRKRRELELLLSKYSLDTIKSQFEALLSDKIDFLLTHLIIQSHVDDLNKRKEMLYFNALS